MMIQKGMVNNINITQHAKERYVKRIMGKEDKTEVALYITTNSEKIEADLETMIAYGELIYSGTSCNNKSQPIDVYIKDTWVLLVDNKYDNLITLYKVDLNVGSEFNKEYVNLMLDKLRLAKEEHEKVKAETHEKCEIYREDIKANQDLIAKYRKYIKAMEIQNEASNNLISTMQIDNMRSEDNIKEIVNTLITKKEF